MLFCIFVIMATITIQIADKDKNLFEQLAKRLNAKIIKSEPDLGVKTPNAVTMKAVDDARKGKTKKIDDIDEFLASL
jgi:hypothetical protein